MRGVQQWWRAIAPRIAAVDRLTWARWSLLLSAALLALPAPAGPAAGGPSASSLSHDHLHFGPFAGLAPMPTTGWTVVADSQELVAANGAAVNVLDGDPGTFWHTQYKPTATPLPHWIVIDMKASTTIGGLTYLPRPPGSRNGNVGQYRVHVSADGVSWGSAVASGTFADDGSLKTVRFGPLTARFVRLTAVTEAGNRGSWTSAAELNLLSATLPSTGWTATADSQELAAEYGAVGNAIDGNPATLWHTQYKPTPAPLPHWIAIDMNSPKTFGGLTYLPRPSGSRNGNIGQYQIHISGDGVSWGQPVASGTFADDSSLKTVNFTPVTARYVRLTALTEAGNRGQWTSAAEISILLTVVPPPDPTKGLWGAPIGFPLVPTAAAQLPDGRLLTWSAYLPNNFTSSGQGQTQTAIFDPLTAIVNQSTVSNTQHEMFCPGTALLPDGRIVVAGGSNSSRTSIYDPATDQWSGGAAMNIPRGYQGMTTLADGEVFVLGGSWSGGTAPKNAEVWSAAGGWQLLPGVPATTIVTADPQGQFRADNQGWFFTWTGDRVFHAGPSKRMNWISTAGGGSVTSAGLRGDDLDAMNGNAVMYDTGKILTIGGATAYQDANARKDAYVIDITNGVSVQKVAPMSFARAFANSVVLPDGSVLVLGGQTRALPFSDAGSVLDAELWSPATQTFTILAAAIVPRNYHSVAMLLPDGRVFSGGGGLCGNCGTNHPDGQIFTPPYLLNPDGTPRPRPSITEVASTVTAGSALSVTTDRTVNRFALVRLGAVTHTVNNDQRRISLTPTLVADTTYTLDIPADRGIVVPGLYMLFALDAAGVPSVAKIVQVG
ncbi:MAG: discoidin domain-containing protein [Micromonosporaceae bacterium]